jgi:hypothetical protein
MTDQHSGPDFPGPEFPGRDLPGSDARGPELDPDEQRLASMLADLADDPDSPPSTVTVDSVLAAVRAQAPAADASGRLPALDVSVPHVSAADVPVPDVPVPDVPAQVGAVPDVPVQDGAAGSGGSVVDGRHRFHGRRRAVLVGVLAAACLAAVAAVVIPLSVRSSNTTSAESALNTIADTAAVAGQTGKVPGQSAADLSAPEAAAGSVPAQPPVPAGSGLADAAVPDQPLTPEAAGGSAAGSAACAWSPLSVGATAALTRSLPSGRFGAPGELIAGCAAEPVAGARLPDSTGGSLVVTVVTAKPGACASGSSNLDATETGIRCVSQGPGRYLSTGTGGAQAAYIYGNGLEVAVGKDQSATGLPEGAPLTADQLFAAAQAVLTAAATG